MRRSDTARRALLAARGSAVTDFEVVRFDPFESDPRQVNFAGRSLLSLPLGGRRPRGPTRGTEPRDQPLGGPHRSLSGRRLPRQLPAGPHRLPRGRRLPETLPQPGRHARRSALTELNSHSFAAVIVPWDVNQSLVQTIDKEV